MANVLDSSVFEYWPGSLCFVLEQETCASLHLGVSKGITKLLGQANGILENLTRGGGEALTNAV